MSARERITGEKGFSLMEVVVAVFILFLVAGPLVSLLTVSLKTCFQAGENTRAVQVAQGILEKLLEPSTEAVSTGAFAIHPDWPEYEYRVTVTPEAGVGLQRITVEVQPAGQPEDVIIFTTLKTRRKLYEALSY